VTKQEQPETLTQLVQDGISGGVTYAQLSKRSVDPDSGYRPSANLLWKVGTGRDVKINPPLVAAIAAGLSLPPVRVQAAAAYQFTGYAIKPLGQGAVVHEPGAEAGDTAHAILERWEKGEGATDRGGAESSG
jgi:hypothetical protein